MNSLVIPVLAIILTIFGCSDRPRINTQGDSDVFVQDFNPPNLDVLWVIDDRSPMQKAAEHLTTEASLFFQRLDASANNYRMAFTTSDMAYAKGTLKTAEPITKSTGDLISRTSNFAAVFQNIINLRTGGLTQGLAAALTSLTNYFAPRHGVPLVLVFMSDSYDRSEAPNTSDTLPYFKDKFIAIAGGNRDLVRAYSLGYIPGGNRCATVYGSDIDLDTTNVGNPYFKLADALGGKTGDVCGSFSSSIDLGGLRLKALPNRFKLTAKPTANGIVVVITKNGAPLTAPSWYFDSVTNEVVFETAPEEGSTIQIIY